MRKSHHRILFETIIGLGLVLVVFYFVGLRNKSIWPAGRVDVDSGHRLVMGTFARIVAVAADSETAERCIETAFAEITRVDKLMSDYKSDSEISQVNRDGFKRAVKVSKSTYEVLQRSVEFSKLTDGAFDVTVGPLVDLWRSAGRTNSVPGNNELNAARSRVGYEKLTLDANKMSVRFTVDGMRLDLGGIAKGYAVDKAIEAMQKCGATGGMVDIGGDIRCFGTPPQGKEHWLIGLQDPSKAEGDIGVGRILLKLKLVNRAVATSGDYQQFTVIEGKRHSHIIDRNTAAGTKGLSSVTIIADNATDTDALATAVSVMGLEKGLKLIESLADTEAILISSEPQYQFVQTKGAQQYISGKLGGTESDKTKRTTKGEKMTKRYEVLRTSEPPKLDGNWTGGVWADVKALDVNNYMGTEPDHKPKTQARLLYDDRFIYVIFRVEDRFVRAVAQNYQGSVYEDSCVEFFFTPANDISLGYFNVEINCGGTMLFHYQPAAGTNIVSIRDSDCDRVEIFHSEPKIVEPEKQEPTTWVIEYRLPIDILEKYCSVTKPAPGILWRANFYKCADKTSHPHWLTWSVIDWPEPDFHRPQFFGTLEFK